MLFWMIRWITLPGNTAPELPCILLWFYIREAARLVASDEEFSLGLDKTYVTSSLPLLTMLLFYLRALRPIYCKCDTGCVCIALKLACEFVTIVISPERMPALAAETSR